ncbi:MAG: type II toxin-antitoxin system HicB family antitoxin, partial [Candidatus Omnitrophica bacterium]|nr:type II toxin-antitoxin system HicB family antitoxin [Candidatus Omnitrophota bacterium]
GWYIGKVPDLPGCHTQAKTIPQLLDRIREAIQLCLDVNRKQRKKFVSGEFVGVQQIEVKV